MNDNSKRFAYVIGFFDDGLGEIEKCENRAQFEEVADEAGVEWAYGRDAVSAMVAAGGAYVEGYCPEDIFNPEGLLVEFDDDGSIAIVRTQEPSFSCQAVFYIEGPDGDAECYEIDRRDF